jgi:hypothetical protein
MQKQAIALAAAALISVPAARAQLSSASQQVDSVQQRRQLAPAAAWGNETNAAPELYAGETDDVGPQSVLQFKPRRTWLEASVDEQYFYSDNVFLANKNAVGADVLVSTVNAAFAPSAFDLAGGKFSPRLGYQHQWFNYDLAGDHRLIVLDYTAEPPSSYTTGLDAFDFNAATVFADTAWSWHDWTFTGGMDFRRLLTSDNYDEFYREYVPRWSVRRDFQICPATSISLVYEGNYRFTESQLPPVGYGRDMNDRTDQSLAVVGSWRVCPRFILQPFYRLQYTHFTKTHRDDVLNSCGLTACFPVTKQAAFRAFVGYDSMETDGFLAQDYTKLEAGIGLNFTLRF